MLAGGQSMSEVGTWKWYNPDVVSGGEKDVNYVRTYHSKSGSDQQFKSADRLVLQDTSLDSVLGT
ncbi:hypothetical protein J6590_061273 [Homalodisca vitripennis]|nr:hypothetical protein J6590_061273 [Homalodisca vitripennis]